MKLIDKAVVVAEINEKLKYANDGITYTQSGASRGLKEYNIDLNAWQHCQSMCEQILSFLDTLEVKEVDLDKEIKDYFNNQPIVTRSKGIDYKLIPSGENIAKHFFELGLKSKGE